MTARAVLLTVLVPAIVVTASGATPAQQRLGAAADLQRTFDGSMLRGWELRFVVRGRIATHSTWRDTRSSRDP